MKGPIFPFLGHHRREPHKTLRRSTLNCSRVNYVLIFYTCKIYYCRNGPFLRLLYDEAFLMTISDRTLSFPNSFLSKSLLRSAPRNITLHTGTLPPNASHGTQYSSAAYNNKLLSAYYPVHISKQSRQNKSSCWGNGIKVKLRIESVVWLLF